MWTFFVLDRNTWYYECLQKTKHPPPLNLSKNNYIKNVNINLQLTWLPNNPTQFDVLFNRSTSPSTLLSFFLSFSFSFSFYYFLSHFDSLLLPPFLSLSLPLSLPLSLFHFLSVSLSYSLPCRSFPWTHCIRLFMHNQTTVLAYPVCRHVDCKCQTHYDNLWPTIPYGRKWFVGDQISMECLMSEITQLWLKPDIHLGTKQIRTRKQARTDFVRVHLINI